MKLKRLVNLEKLKKALPMTVILIVAALAVYLANQYLTSRSNEIEQSLQDQADKMRAKVTVPVVDLNPGDVLSMEQVAARSVPKEYMNFDVIPPENIDAYIGKKIIRPVRKGTPLLESYFLLYESVPFSKTIEAGNRAITIPVDEINSFSGLLRAGDRIDLFYLMKPPTLPLPGVPQEDMLMAPLLENVEVRATGQTTVREVVAADQARQSGMPDQMGRGKQSYHTVTIAVSAEDAQRVILVQTGARIVAVLRRPDDNTSGQSKLYLSDVVGQPRRPKPVLPPGPEVQYIIGGRFNTGDNVSGDDPEGKLAALKRLFGSMGANKGQ
jgi:pilus assembly protein CpaB